MGKIYVHGAGVEPHMFLGDLVNISNLNLKHK